MNISILFILQLVKEAILTPDELGWFPGCLVLGQLLGILLGPLLADLVNRLQCTFLSSKRYYACFYTQKCVTTVTQDLYNSIFYIQRTAWNSNCIRAVMGFSANHIRAKGPQPSAGPTFTRVKQPKDKDEMGMHWVSWMHVVRRLTCFLAAKIKIKWKCIGFHGCRWGGDSLVS